ncbi:hypothetical protein GC175_23175 [bacterium]|nr:hypothetical protein [bacterium]
MTLKANESDRLQDLLQDLFRFNQADLRANRRGNISEAQKQRMDEKHEDDARLTYGGLIAILLIGYAGSGAAALQGGLSIWEMWRGVTVSLLVLFLFAWILLHFNGMKMRRTLREGAVKQVSGPMRLIREGGKSRSHYFAVGPQRFEITEFEYFRLKQHPLDGRQATVYYALPWRRVLSVALQSL